MTKITITTNEELTEFGYMEKGRTVSVEHIEDKTEKLVEELNIKIKKLQKENDELKKVNDDLIKKDVSILVMDYIHQGLDLHYLDRINSVKKENEILRLVVEKLKKSSLKIALLNEDEYARILNEAIDIEYTKAQKEVEELLKGLNK
jgi:signal recognition particle GTPase